MNRIFCVSIMAISVNIQAAEEQKEQFPRPPHIITTSTNASSAQSTAAQPLRGKKRAHPLEATCEYPGQYEIDVRFTPGYTHIVPKTGPFIQELLIDIAQEDPLFRALIMQADKRLKELYPPLNDRLQGYKKALAKHNQAIKRDKALQRLQHQLGCTLNSTKK